MRIVQINSFSNGSTGKIMMSIHKSLINKGYDSYIIWGRGRKSNNYREIYLNDKIGVCFHVLYSRLTGKMGFASKYSTKKLIKILNKLKPDIVHLHNIHGYYINIEMLFNYLKNNNIKVVWTLHDCWAFTGHCPYFSFKDCQKWKNGCFNCPLLQEYPKTIKDNSKWNYIKKKELFTGFSDLMIVTPSKWLSTLIEYSFLKEYPLRVINNGIDTKIFKPISTDFRKKHNLENKRIILGVASVWDSRKGLNDFIKLSKVIDDNYVIVLVGLNRKQIKCLPNNIIGITRTENQLELAGIYSTSDILFNPTYEDNYPTVNIESLACGTPVLTYDTGGSPEFTDFFIDSMNYVIKKEDANNNILFVKKRIDNILEQCFINVNSSNFSEENMVARYVDIYVSILKK